MKHCGRAACTSDLSGMRPNAKWCSQKCAMRVRRGEKPLQTPTSGPSGLQVSYRRMVESLLDCPLFDPEGTLDLVDLRREAEYTVTCALSDRQRARLDARRGQ